jgi:hypothetical protein
MNTDIMENLEALSSGNALSECRRTAKNYLEIIESEDFQQEYQDLLKIMSDELLHCILLKI